MRMKNVWNVLKPFLVSTVAGWFVWHLLDYYDLFPKLMTADQSSGARDLYKSLLKTKYSPFDIFLILLFATVIYLLALLVNREFFGAEAKLTKAKKSLSSFRNLTFEENMLRFTWEIVFNRWNKPEIENLRPFCIWHDPPIQMPYDEILEEYRCHHCANSLTKPRIATGSTYGNAFDGFKVQIQALLDRKWEELNKKA